MVFQWWRQTCGIYTYIVTFFAALVGMDWYQVHLNSESNCFGFIAPFF